MSLPLRLTGLAAALSLALTACSGSSGDAEPDAESSSPTASETPYLDVPEGVELTEQGSTLEVGDTATVAYEPRQGTIGALEITVTSLERATFKLFEGWDIDKATRKTTPYFVRARVTNVGSTNLGEERVPLYIVDDENRLVESSVFDDGTFKPCDGAFFPKKFRNGDKVRACMVYLAPERGRLTAVSFRPTQEFNPITWEGEVTKADDGSDKKKDSKKKKKRDGRKRR